MYILIPIVLLFWNKVTGRIPQRPIKSLYLSIYARPVRNSACFMYVEKITDCLEQIYYRRYDLDQWFFTLLIE